MQATLREVDQAALWIRQVAQNTKVEPALMFKLANVWRDVRTIEEDLATARDAILAKYKTHPIAESVQFDDFADVPRYGAELRALLETEVEMPHVRAKLPFALFVESNSKITDEANRMPFSAEVIDLTRWLIEYPEGTDE